MKLLRERDAFLLDFEVLQHLTEYKNNYNWTFGDEETPKGRRYNAAGVGLEAITRDTLLYFELRASTFIASQDVFRALMEYLNTLDLMKIEKLQIVNSLPRSMVHLYALVDECDQRFEEAACEALLAKIDELVPLPVQDEAEAEAMEAERDV